MIAHFHNGGKMNKIIVVSILALVLVSTVLISGCVTPDSSPDNNKGDDSVQDADTGQTTEPTNSGSEVTEEKPPRPPE